MSETVENPLEIARQMGQRSSQEKRVSEWVDTERPESVDSFEKLLKTRPYQDKEGVVLAANGQPIESLYTTETVEAEQTGPTELELEHVSDFDMIEGAIKDLLSKEYDSRRQHSRTVIVDLLKENTQDMTLNEIDQLAAEQQQAGNEYVARLLKAKAEKRLSRNTDDEESAPTGVSSEDQTEELEPVPSEEPEVQLEVEPEEATIDDTHSPEAAEIFPTEAHPAEDDSAEVNAPVDTVPVIETGNTLIEEYESQGSADSTEVELLQLPETEEILDETERLDRISEIETETIPMLKARRDYARAKKDIVEQGEIEYKIEFLLNEIRRLSKGNLSDEDIKEIDRRTEELAQGKKKEFAYMLRDNVIIPKMREVVDLRPGLLNRRKKERLHAEIDKETDALLSDGFDAGFTKDEAKEFLEEIRGIV